VSEEEWINLEKNWNGSVKAGTAVRACILAGLRARARLCVDVAGGKWGRFRATAKKLTQNVFFLNLTLGLSAKIIK